MSLRQKIRYAAENLVTMYGHDRSSFRDTVFLPSGLGKTSFLSSTLIALHSLVESCRFDECAVKLNDDLEI